MMLPSSRLSLLRNGVQQLRKVHTSGALSAGHGEEWYWGHEVRAGREIVGFGCSGEPDYSDRIDFPYPAVRFRKDDDVIKPIRQKEMADWKNLSLAEKKMLYRYSFCETLCEVEAPRGYWRKSLSVWLYGVALSCFFAAWTHKYVYPELPSTFTEEHREAMLQRMIDLRGEPIDGIGSKWDYEKNVWKA